LYTLLYKKPYFTLQLKSKTRLIEGIILLYRYF
jgi:hypothetical protein